MTIDTRNDLIVSAVDLVPWQARRFPRLPRGISADDLESAGNEALVHAATTWDEDVGTPWRTYARTCVRNAMRSVVAHARSRRQTALEIEGVDGELLPRPDPRAEDPAERAAARELVTPRRRRQHLGVIADGPDPSAVATRAAALREAMFHSIRDEDAAAIVGQVVTKAKAGDLKAARLFFDLLAPSRCGSTIVQQQAVVICGDDL
jgi:DNA-directed RNA polymerase specialized sigma24 family protein